MRVEPIDEELSRLLRDANHHDFIRLTSLKSGFDDLRVLRDDTGKSYWCSAQANPEVDRFEVHGSSRSAEASPLEVWTYISTLEGRLYSDPPCHRIGEAVIGGFGELPDFGWESFLGLSKINKDLIKKIRHWLEARPPIYYE